MSANQRSKLGGWVPRPVRKGAPLECRVCLEPSGDTRPCCNEPLCVHCWSVEGFCPRCKSEIKMVNQVNVKVKEGEYLRAKDAKRVSLKNIYSHPSLSQLSHMTSTDLFPIMNNIVQLNY